jgi:hypothetical protein
MKMAMKDAEKIQILAHGTKSETGMQLQAMQ